MESDNNATINTDPAAALDTSDMKLPYPLWQEADFADAPSKADLVEVPLANLCAKCMALATYAQGDEVVDDESKTKSLAVTEGLAELEKIFAQQQASPYYNNALVHASYCEFKKSVKHLVKLVELKSIHEAVKTAMELVGAQAGQILSDIREKEAALDYPKEKRIPVGIITGFLGSGKTTLLNYILTAHHGKRIAVIENEFGEIGVDDALIKDKFESNEEIFMMNNGCICCTVRGDLIRILRRLVEDQKGKFDYILIETTGLADPAPIAQTFFIDPKLSLQLVLDSIITVVDAKHILQHLEEIKPEGVENESVEQIAFADVVLLNKMDLVKGQGEDHVDRIKSKIREINADVAILPTVRSVVDLDKILNVRAFDLEQVLRMDPQFLVDQEHTHDQSVTSVGLVHEGEADAVKMNEWLGTMLSSKGTDIFRMKGIIAVKGWEQKFVFQGVHMLVDSNTLDSWKPDEKRVSKLVFIGRNLDRAELTASFLGCFE